MIKINQCLITVTRACNLRCNFCYAKEAGYKASDFINFDSIKKLIDLCNDAEAKYIVLTGGEPLLYPELFKLLDYINSRPHKMIIALATNGILLENFDFCEKILNYGVSYVDVSMKGKDKQEWLDVTEYDGSQQQLKAISNLSRLNVDFTCSMVITHKNVGNFCETIENSYNAGARSFSFTFVIDNRESEENDLQYLKVHNPLLLVNRFISQIDELDRITKGEWWIEYSFPECVYTEEQLEKLKDKLAAPCYIRSNTKNFSFEFDTKLNLIPCGMFLKDVMGKFGSDFSSASELERYINTGLYKSITSSLRELPADHCLLCTHRASCLGGCPWFWRHCSFEAFQNFKEIMKISQ